AMRRLAVLAFLLFSSFARGSDLPIFDAHLHYSHDAWDVVPVEEVISILRKAGIKRALVSSSGDEGQQRLYRAAPDLVVPSLRPYRRRGEIGTWFRDDSVIAYLEEHLKKNRYAAIGEYHIYGADADLPVPRRMVELARRYGLFLHSHSDADAIERQFRQWPQARILWAHAGFDRPEVVADLLRRHSTLWCDLAFRTDHASGGKVDAAWRKVFLEFPDRFMVGTDSFTPERWHYVPEHAAWSREWLADLPREVREQIAWKNGERLFGSALRRSD
ncbi:MAG TPA: amidohydrolase family protein, partial [Burkholderiales bacterium]|nr:amidohydrolase family protein [Burkholderiales bacterium]